jgi:putative lipoic acid-binding regulatory protein
MSDIRLKKNIKPLENCLDKVLSLNGVSFDWKDENKGSSIGFIAQDFEKTVPELVQEKPDISDGTKMHKSIQYANLNAMLVEAIKEQQDQIEYLKSELIKLKENNNGSND